MKCPKCGEELEFVRDLTEDEIFDWEYIQELEKQVLENSNIDYNLEDEDLLVHLKAFYNVVAVKDYTKILFFRKLAKEIKTDINDIHIVEYKIWKHPSMEK